MTDSEAPPLVAAMEAVTDAAITVEEWTAESGDDLLDVAEKFAMVDDTIHTLMIARDIIKATIVKRSHWKKADDYMGWVLGEDRFPVQLPGGGMLVRRGGKEATRYDQSKVIARFAGGITQELLEADVASRALTADGTIVPLEQVVDRVCARFAEAAGATAPSFTNWRSGIAQQLGVDIRNLSEKKLTDVSLSVEGRRA